MTRPSDDPTRGDSETTRSGGDDARVDDARGEASAPGSSTAAPLSPGEVYAARYRIIERLGSGGMGEVYRAYDSVLHVEVALKRVIRADPQHVAQVVREVRLARQITHRAVCRVYDVGETGGAYYITMEYVDGEDFGSLLRRIGRLPSAKVIDVARQLCAGLAAAHAQGILHRDLKPANVMFDRRGDVRITDFGIAAIESDRVERGGPADRRGTREGDRDSDRAADRVGGRVIFGTPAYMAPEQLAGRPASAQSDLFALGLVLYEILTGRHAFDPRREPLSSGDPPPSAVAPSSFLSDVDPRLERVILQALDQDPARRPASAIAFSAALPGGDVLQAALEAGETPSPELVASAGASGVLSARVAASLIATAVLGLAVIVTTAHIRLIDRVPLVDPPAVLAAKARAVVREVTGEPAAPHHVFTLQGDGAYLRHLANNPATDVDPSRLARVVYRESPEPIAPSLPLAMDGEFEVTVDNPPMTVAGMKTVVMDPGGRLRLFRAVPRGVGGGVAAAGTASDGRGARQMRETDWRPFLRESGVDPTSLVPETDPGDATSSSRGDIATLPPYGDQRMTWRGRDAVSGQAVRIRAAAMTDGAPTWFEVRPLAADRENSETPGGRAIPIFTALFSIVVLSIAPYLAWRNVKRGRADVRGATRLGVVIFASSLAETTLGASFLPFELEYARTLVTCSLLLMGTLIAVSLYLAFEPFVRRRWPTSLIAWNRLLAGRLRDPRVGRDLLIGATASIAGTALYHLLQMTSPGLHGDRPVTLSVNVFMGARHLLGTLLGAVPGALSSAMLVTLLYSLFVQLVRRTSIAAAILLAIFLVPVFLQGTHTPFELVVQVIAILLLVLVFLQFGLLALAAYMLLDLVTTRLPLTLTGDWRTEFSIVSLIVLGSILAFATYTSIGVGLPGPSPREGASEAAPVRRDRRRDR